MSGTHWNTEYLRKPLLLLHVLTSVGFVGAVAGFLALAIAGGVVGNSEIVRAVYISSEIVTWNVIVPLAWASLLIGIFQSLVGPWGLFRHYWIVVKLVLSIVAVLVLMIQTQNIGLMAQMALADRMEGLTAPRASMTLHGIGGLIVLVVVTVLSIYKPRGLTPFGMKRTA